MSFAFPWDETLKTPALMVVVVFFSEPLVVSLIT
jgi:hypothetical protein